MNKELYNKKVRIPEELITLLKKSQGLAKDMSDEEKSKTQGWKRNVDLCNNKYITYQNAKRIKNWFDDPSTPNEGISFDLHGGEKFKNWIYKMLEDLRSGNIRNKKVKSTTSTDSEFIKDRENNVSVIDNTHTSQAEKLGKPSTKDLNPFNEQINRIKNIISYGKDRSA